MKFAVIALVLGLSTVVQAAPSASLKCKATDKSEVVEALELSKDGSEIVQIAPAAMIGNRLIIDTVVIKGLQTVISGRAVDVEPRACAGSCPLTSFELTTTNARIYPNAAMVMTTSGFDELKGTVVTTSRKTTYSCSLVGIQATKPQVIKSNVVRIDGKVQKDASGVTTIDKVAKKISVAVTTNLCPRGVICVAGPITQTYSVPLQGSGSDGCAINTAGAEDKRAVDGSLITINVEDNTKNTCESGGLVESLYLTTVTIEGKGRGGPVNKVIELLAK